MNPFLLIFLFAQFLLLAQAQRAYSYGYIYYELGSDTPGCLTDATPVYVLALLETMCYGDGSFPPRITRSNSSGIIIDYYQLGSFCQGSINQTLFFPFNECTTQPFDVTFNPNTGSNDILFFMAVEGGVTDFPPLPVEITPEVLNPIPGMASQVALFYESNCPGLPNAVFYTVLGRCTSIISLFQVEPSVLGSCEMTEDGNSVVTVNLHEQEDSTCTLEPASSLSIPANICIPFGGNSSFIQQCFFPGSVDNGEDNTNAIILAVVIPSFCLCFVVILVFAGLYYHHQKSKINLDLGGIPVVTNVKVLDIIGSGNFGSVYRGQKKNGTIIALKTVQREEITNLAREMEIMIDLKHPNIVSFFGVFFQGLTSIYMVLEFMENGDLLKLLREDCDIPFSQLLDFCKQAASGMEYLHSKSIVHRDLACRNLLVTTKNSLYICKVSDFGLSRSVESEYVSSSSTNVPVRWTPPEALQYAKYSEASDVWSYGITMWEIYSRGVVPYVGLKNSEVYHRVNEGETLLPPQGTPDVIYHLMRTTWHQDPNRRPSFTSIISQLEQITPQQIAYQGLKAESTHDNSSESSRNYTEKAYTASSKKVATNYSESIGKGVITRSIEDEVEELRKENDFLRQKVRELLTKYEPNSMSQKTFDTNSTKYPYSNYGNRNM